MADFIMRHAFVDENEEKEAKERLALGTSTAGIIIDLTKKGMEINGYYKLSNEAKETHGTLRKPLLISWDDLEKFKESLNPVKKQRKEKQTGIESPFDIEYLKTLPKVHINGTPYYIDLTKQEMRAVASPKIAFKLQGKI